MRILYKVSLFLYHLLPVNNLISRKTVTNLQILAPGKSQSELRENYLIEKIRYILMILIIGTIFGFLIYISKGTEGKLSDQITLILLFSGTLIFVWIMKDLQVEKQVEKRKNKLSNEYQAVVEKLALYIGAGMNLSGAWCKVALDGKKHPVYEEMIITVREMEGGIAEKEAYERFALRIRQQEYIRLITFFVQNLQKGNRELLSIFKHEAIYALSECQAGVRRKGEEMGTKLLFPMIIMLVMVMIFIIMPVFLSM